MNANIYRFEFQNRLKSVVIWSIALVTIIMVFFSIYTGFADQAALLNEMMSQFPPQLLEAFGMTGLDFASVLGYFSLLFLFAQICLAIQASYYGFGLVSVEETDLTADFLLSKPVSRAQIMTSKLLAAFTGLLITNLVVWVSAFAAIALFSAGRAYETRPLFLLLGSIAIFQLFFLAVGLVISLLVKRVRSVTPYALGLAFGMYALSAFSDIGEVSVLELITPFKYFDASFIVMNNAYDTPLVLLTVAIVVVALAASYWLYLRRDIPSVT